MSKSYQEHQAMLAEYEEHFKHLLERFREINNLPPPDGEGRVNHTQRHHRVYFKFKGAKEPWVHQVVIEANYNCDEYDIYPAMMDIKIGIQCYVKDIPSPILRLPQAILDLIPAQKEVDNE